MRLVFNLTNTGLGNNGGSRTLIKCGEALSKLGIEVIMFSNIKSGYNWHKPVGLKFAKGDKPPKSDVVCATGYKSVPSTLKAKAKKKIYYIRGFELWQANKKKLLDSYKQLDCFVNSEWLKKYLNKKNINCELIYPGLDFEDFYKRDLDRRNNFGALFHKRHATKRHRDAQSCAELTGITLKMLNRDIKNPSKKQLNKWYNRLKVWFAPSELEGLHNPPMEASLAGCALVATDHARSGMSDYIIHNETALVYPARDLKKASNYISLLMKNEVLRKRLNDNMIDLLTKKIGTRKHNMTKFLEMLHK